MVKNTSPISNMKLTLAQIENIQTNHESTSMETTPSSLYQDYVNDLRINNMTDPYASNKICKDFNEYIKTTAIDDYAVLIRLAIEAGEYASIISFKEWVNR